MELELFAWYSGRERTKKVAHLLCQSPICSARSYFACGTEHNATPRMLLAHPLLSTVSEDNNVVALLQPLFGGILCFQRAFPKTPITTHAPLNFGRFLRLQAVTTLRGCRCNMKLQRAVLFADVSQGYFVLFVAACDPVTLEKERPLFKGGERPGVHDKLDFLCTITTACNLVPPWT